MSDNYNSHNYNEELIYPEDKYINSPRIPFYKPSTKFSSMSPISFLPMPFDSNEVFAYIHNGVIPNIYPNRYFISNYGRIWDAGMQRFVFLGYSLPYESDGYNDGYLVVSLSVVHAPNFNDFETFQVHRLVMMTFKPIPNPEVFEVNHLDGNHTNNNLLNLEWCTSEENIAHAVKNGFTNGKKMIVIPLSEQQLYTIHMMMLDGKSDSDIFYETLIPMSAINQFRSARAYIDFIRKLPTRSYAVRRLNNAKMSENTIYDICTDISKGMSTKEITEKYKVARHIVNDIKFRKNHTNISKNFVFPQAHSPINEDTVHIICKMLEAGKGVTDISRELNVSFDAVQHIKSGSSWSNISSLYNIPKPNKLSKKLPDDIVKTICQLLQESRCGISDQQIADMVGNNVKSYTVRDIRLRSQYTNISSNYQW